MKNTHRILRFNYGSSAVFRTINKNTAKALVKAVEENSFENPDNVVVTINGIRYTLVNRHFNNQSVSMYFITETNKYIRISDHWCADGRKVKSANRIGKSYWYLEGDDESFTVTFMRSNYKLEGGIIPMHKFNFR